MINDNVVLKVVSFIILPENVSFIFVVLISYDSFLVKYIYVLRVICIQISIIIWHYNGSRSRSVSG